MVNFLHGGGEYGSILEQPIVITCQLLLCDVKLSAWYQCRNYTTRFPKC